MAEHVLASTMIAPKTFEPREYLMPDIPPKAGAASVPSPTGRGGGAFVFPLGAWYDRASGTLSSCYCVYCGGSLHENL